MRIALIGYGKMGHIIEEIALQHGHEVVLKISSSNAVELTAENIRKADVAIEFTRPEAAKQNVLLCLNAGVPVVCGTTGWGEGLEEAKAAALANNTAFLHATNFSIGVNIFFEVNKLLAQLMDGRTEYDVSIEEIHHLQKKDAPSGTAITLAEQVLEKLSQKNSWALNAQNPSELNIIAKREDGVPGTHTVKYSSSIDDIEITHTAHNRHGFASGAVAAAAYIIGKAGVYGMSDVLDF